MIVVWKYVLDNEVINIPEGAKFRHFGTDPQGRVCIWFEVEIEHSHQTEKRAFSIVGTSQAVPPNGRYKGTTLGGQFVWHLYEVGG